MKIWAKTAEYSEGKFLVVRRDGTVPAWPHFVLGGRDPYAPAALRAYVKEYLSRANPADEEYANSILELASDFERYNQETGNGDPESGPHRVDDPDVIAVMRAPGCKALVKIDHGD
jgi:hypothetical protein